MKLSTVLTFNLLSLITIRGRAAEEGGQNFLQILGPSDGLILSVDSQFGLEPGRSINYTVTQWVGADGKLNSVTDSSVSLSCPILLQPGSYEFSLKSEAGVGDLEGFEAGVATAKQSHILYCPPGQTRVEIEDSGFGSFSMYAPIVAVTYITNNYHGNYYGNLEVESGAAAVSWLDPSSAPIGDYYFASGAFLGYTMHTNNSSSPAVAAITLFSSAAADSVSDSGVDNDSADGVTMAFFVVTVFGQPATVYLTSNTGSTTVTGSGAAAISGAPVITPQAEIPSTNSVLPVYFFSNAASGSWFGITAGEALDFGVQLQTLDGSLVQSVTFPSDVTNQFSIMVGENTLGPFSGGQTVWFTNLPRGGVGQFSALSGGQPLPVSAGAELPLLLRFNSTNVTFSLTPYFYFVTIFVAISPR